VRWKQTAHGALSRHRRSYVVKSLARAARAVTNAVENDSGDAASNGEEWLVSRLPAVGVAVDVGAHRGRWTDLVLRAHPGARVHQFELDPDLADELARRAGEDPRIVVYRCGLSDSDREVSFGSLEGHPEMSSVLAANDQGWSRRVGRVRPLDEVLAEAGVEAVDVLKVDAEGHDLEVLRGAQRLLRDHRVGVVQFEFTLWAVRARHWLADFYDELLPAGYRIGKLYPDGVAWRHYEPTHEQYFRANFVAVHEGRPDLVARLACP